VGLRDVLHGEQVELGITLVMGSGDGLIMEVVDAFVA